jgi:outer membrane autotransporter protein
LNDPLAQQNSSLFVSSTFFQHAAHLRYIRFPCTQERERDNAWHIWGDGGIDGSWQKGNHQNVGFHAKTGLGVLGIDYRLTEHLYLGVLGAHTGTSIDSHYHLAKGKTHAYYTGLYSHWLHPRYFANAFVITSSDDYHSKRVVKFGTINRQPHGHHRGHSFLSHLDLGATFGNKHRAQMSPYGRLDYLYQREKGYTETQAQSLDNNIRPRSSNMLRSELGVEGRYCWFIRENAFVPSGKLGWVHETRFAGKKINARLVDVPNRYHVIGLYPNRSLMVVGASLVADVYASRVYLSLDYEGFFGSKYQSNTGNISLNLQF